MKKSIQQKLKTVARYNRTNHPRHVEDRERNEIFDIEEQIKSWMEYNNCGGDTACGPNLKNSLTNRLFPILINIIAP